MEEDSERRRERLKAMRTAAQDEASACTNVGNPAMAGSLANPLLETPETVSAANDGSRATPRFDFYTDPLAIFSDNKKRSATGVQSSTQSYFPPPSNRVSPMERFPSPHPGPWGTKMTSSPHQMQNIYASNPNTYQAQGPYRGAAPYNSPRAPANSFPMHQGTPQTWSGSGGTPNDYSAVPHRGMSVPYPTHQRNPGFGPAGRPSFNYGQGRPCWQGNSPRPGSGYRGSPNSLGRGQRQQHGGHMGPDFGRSGGRGRGFHSHNSAPDQSLGPECYYHESMVEDPWQHLEPVVWRGLDTPSNNLNTAGSSNSWLPKSISMKKPRVSEPSNKSTSQQSLAEYLAASFHDTVNDTPSDDI